MRNKGEEEELEGRVLRPQCRSMQKEGKDRGLGEKRLSELCQANGKFSTAFVPL